MRRFVRVVSLALLAGACGSARQPSAPVPPGPGLRGIPVRTFECPPHPVSSAATVTPIRDVQALRLCPLGMPGRRDAVVTVTAGAPRFDALISALAASDERRTGEVCPAYADLLQVVLAKTRDRVYQVSIPTDACGHYQRGALDALQRARGA